MSKELKKYEKLLEKPEKLSPHQKMTLEYIVKRLKSQDYSAIPQKIPEGSRYYNTDIKKWLIYKNGKWESHPTMNGDNNG